MAKFIGSNFRTDKVQSVEAAQKIAEELGAPYVGLDLEAILKKVGFDVFFAEGHCYSLNFWEEQKPGYEAVRVLNALSPVVNEGLYLLWEDDDLYGPKYFAWVTTSGGIRVRKAEHRIDGVAPSSRGFEKQTVFMLDGRESGPSAAITVPESEEERTMKLLKYLREHTEGELDFDEVACRLVCAGAVFDGPVAVVRTEI